MRRLLQYCPRAIRIFSNDENGQFSLQEELQAYQNVRFLLGDIRDKERLARAVEDVDTVFHAAAFKHVPLCEYNSFEAILTNVVGTQNVLDVSMNQNLERVISVSTDKAVSPINTMGATKLLAEKLVIDANFYKGNRKTVFSSVRLGNIIGSRGSVILSFAEQIRRGGPVTITDPGMTRFMMSLNQAVTLVLKATEMALGGEVFVFKMPVVKISDLVEVMIQELAPEYGYRPAQIEVKVIGIRPGEKLSEDLMTEEEAKNVQETQEMFIILPHIDLSTCRTEDYTYPGSKLEQVSKYTSKDGQLLSPDEIRVMLRESFQGHLAES